MDINQLNPGTRIFNSPYKSLANLKMKVAYNLMKSAPFRFDPFLRKILRAINNNDSVQQNLLVLQKYVDKGIQEDLAQLPPQAKCKDAFKKKGGSF